MIMIRLCLVWAACRQLASRGDGRLANVGSNLRAMTALDDKADDGA